MILINMETEEPLRVGDIVTTFRGERMSLTGWREPHKPGSTGKIYVKGFDDNDYEAMFYPGVIGAKFVEENK